MKKKSGTFLLWKDFFKKNLYSVVFFLLLSTISGICEILFIFLLRYLVTNQIAQPYFWVVVALSLMVLRTLVQVFNIQLLTIKIEQWCYYFKKDLYTKLLQRSFPLHRIEIAKQWKQIHVQLLPLIRKGIFSLLFSLSSGIQIFLCILVIFIFPWTFIFSLFMLLIPIIIFSRWRIKILNKAGSQWVSSQQTSDLMMNEVSNALDFICGNQQLKKTLKTISQENKISSKKESHWNMLQFIFPYIMEFLYFVVALLLFSFIVPSFNLVSDIFPFVLLMLILYRPIREWSRLYPDVSIGNEAFFNWNLFVEKIESSPKICLPKFHEKKTIECVNIHFNYTNKNIFSNFNIILDLTKITCLIGTNGIGKTTFLRLLSRMEFPKKGYILYAQEVTIGYLSQQSVFSPFWLENVYYLKSIYPEDFKNLVSILEIQSLLESFIKPEQVYECSGGERQRLHLLQGLLQPCSFILMDEPTTWISLGSQVDIMKKIIAYWKNRWSRLQNPCGMLIVSHDEKIRKLSEVEITL